MWLLWLLLVPVVLVGSFFMYFFVKEKLSERKITNVKTGQTVPTSPFYDFWRDRIMGKTFFESSQEKFEKYGKIWHQNVLFRPTVNVNDAETAKIVSLEYEKNQKPPQMKLRFLNWFFGKNVVTTNGEEWRKLRKIMDPAFYKLDVFTDIFADRSLYCMKTMKVNEPIKVYDYVQRMALDILALSAFGQDLRYMDNPDNKFLKAYNFAFDNLFRVLYFMFPWLAYAPTNYVRKMSESLSALDTLMEEIIERAKNRSEESPQKTLLDMMIDACRKDSENSLTPKELRDNVLIFFVAGHETTATSLTFLFFALAKNPDIQQKLYEEIKTVIGDEVPTYDKVNACNYLNALVKEGLRLYPPVPSIPGRITTEDQVLCDYNIPTGTLVQLYAYGLHTDEKYWKEPLKFRPERWLNQDEVKMRHPFCYIPFSAGKRVCIGNNFSLLEQKIFIAILLQRFSIELPDPSYEIKLHKGKFLNVPEEEFKVIVRPRK